MRAGAAMPGDPAVFRIESVYRYPVKSMGGECPPEIMVEEGHVLGDRQWAVVDAGTGFTLSAKRHGVLLEASARTGDNGEVVVTLPSGVEVEAGEPSANATVSQWLDREVELRQPGSGNLPFELLADALDEASEVIAFSTPPTHFADFADVHLLTRASLRAAHDLYPGGDWDVRRFRPTALIEAEGEDFAEDAWVGSRVQLGSQAVVEVFMPAVRCSLPPRAQPGLRKDMSISTTLRDHHNFSLGVYCAIRSHGFVRPGDEVVVG
ncbi:MAG: MOSC domain-containing protein [Acidimicrobiales bacterium]